MYTKNWYISVKRKIRILPEAIFQKEKYAKVTLKALFETYLLLKKETKKLVFLLWFMYKQYFAVSFH